MEDLVMFDDVFAGRRVFVTGHTGFKGSWLASWLLRLGAEVTGYALAADTVPSLFESLGLEAHVGHVLGDVRDRARLVAELKAARPSVVFHLAAQPLVSVGYAEPEATFATNVMGTVSVLEAVRACDSVEAVVVVTSDKCYDNPEDGHAFREEDPMGGRDPYSASKGCAELVTSSYRASFFAGGRCAAVATVRAGNVIGGGDWAQDRIVPDCVRALSAGRPIVVRSPDSVRPWQHVLEPLAGYLWLGARLVREGHAFAGAWNFGPSVEDAARPVHWIVERFLDEWGEGSWETEGAPSRLREAGQLALDSRKARELLAWAPVWDAGTAVRHTASWYRELHRAPAAAGDLVGRDIREYEVAAGASALAWTASARDGARPSGGTS